MHLKLTESPVYEILPEIGLKIEGAKEGDDKGEVVDAAEVGGLERKVRKKGRILDLKAFNVDDQVEEGQRSGRSTVVNVMVEEAKKNVDDSSNQVNNNKKKSKKLVEEGESIGGDGGDLSVRKKMKKKKKVAEEDPGSSEWKKEEREKYNHYLVASSLLVPT